MSAYSLAHVLDVPGWPTVWGLAAESTPQEAVQEEVLGIQEDLLVLTARLQRLQKTLATAA